MVLILFEIGCPMAKLAAEVSWKAFYQSCAISPWRPGLLKLEIVCSPVRFQYLCTESKCCGCQD